MHRVDDLNKWPLRILAFIVAILLFLFVNYEHSRSVSSLNPGNQASVTTEEIIDQVPIEINIDSEEFYVSGIPQKASVKIEGSQSLVTQYLATTTVVAQTPDLNELGVGDHVIQLEIEDLPNRLNASFDPAEIHITIERRVSQQYDVSLEFDPDLVADGFQVGQAQLSHSQVMVSGRESEMENIDRIAVIIPEEGAPYSENINDHFPLVALNEQNEWLDVTIEPAEVHVSIPILGAEKTVPVRIESRGGVEGFNYEVDIASDQMKAVTLRGPQSVLNGISSIPVVINLDGITNSTSRTIDLQPPAGVTEMSLEAVTVVINAQPDSAGQKAGQSSSTDSPATAADRENSAEEVSQEDAESDPGPSDRPVNEEERENQG